MFTAKKPIDPSGSPPGVSASFAGVIEHTQRVAQREVAKLVTGAKWISDTHSRHKIMLDDPALVSRSTNEVVQTLREGRTTMNGSLEIESHDRINQGTEDR